MLSFSTLKNSLLLRVFLVGLLLGLPFLSSLFWWAVVPAVVMLLHVFKEGKYTWKQVLGYGVLLGFVQYGFGIGWFWNTYPLDWIGVGPWGSFWFILIYWGTVTLSMALGKVFLVWFLVQRHIRWRYTMLLLPLVWVFSEILTPLFFSMYSIGPGGSINIDFTFGSIGYVLAEHAVLVHFATYGGLYLLTFIYICIATYIYIVSTKQILHAVFLFIVFFLCAYLPVPEKEASDEYRVYAVETTFDYRSYKNEEGYQERFEVLRDEIVYALQEGYTHIVLPEDMRFSQGFTSEQEVLAFMDKHRVGDAVLIDSTTVSGNEAGTVYIRAFIYDTKTQKLYVADKKQLVPQGEYMPYLAAVPLRLLGYGDMVDQFTDNYNYVPGTASLPADTPAHIPGVLFCFEASVPFGVRNAAGGRDVLFVAHPVSHAWFKDPDALWHQLDMILAVNARFGGFDLIQAGNMAASKRY